MLIQMAFDGGSNVRFAVKNIAADAIFDDLAKQTFNLREVMLKLARSADAAVGDGLAML